MNITHKLVHLILLMERSAKEVAERMKDDAVDTVFLVPV